MLFSPRVRDHSGSLLAKAASLSWLLVFLGVYLAAAGHGFIKDDVVWIQNSQIHAWHDLLRVLHADNGFYRPIVSLTFAADAWIFGTRPRGYGLTNVVLALLCCGSIIALTRGLRLHAGAAILAGALWALNVHGVGGSMLWISGRTALLLTLLATASANALVRQRMTLSAVLLLAALFAKEEAVLLPVILVGWLYARRSTTPVTLLRLAAWTTVFVAAVALYLVARASTHAMTPFAAPASYRLTFDPGTVFSNAWHYADWSATVSAAVTIIAVLVLGRPRSIDRDARRVLACGALWILVGFGITVFVPSRSDLYVCFPSVGACLIAATLCQHAWMQASAARRPRALMAAVVLPLALSPAYCARAGRMVAIADLSADTLRALPALTAGLPAGATVVIEDDRGQRANLEAAFGTLLNEAYRVTAGRQLSLWIDPAVHNADLAGLHAPCDTCVDLRLRVAHGTLEVIPGR